MVLAGDIYPDYKKEIGYSHVVVARRKSWLSPAALKLPPNLWNKTTIYFAHRIVGQEFRDSRIEMVHLCSIMSGAFDEKS